MAKLEDLPLAGGPQADPPPRGPDFRQFLDRLEAHLDDGDLTWAWELLEGIRETVRRTQRVTERQVEAVENVEKARRDREEGRHRRRSTGGVYRSIKE